MKCVVDQNGNHVVQKCIEAASCKKHERHPYGSHVTADDIQFILNDIVGHVIELSTHAYGCRVIQRVLEHCSPSQVRPIVDEIIARSRELVKDQYGNYVVQHVIIHGETDQRNIVMQAIVPEIAKWSQHKYASNVVEACLEQATPPEICQIVDFILACDESGESCPLLPMMKHMYGNYVVQKLLDKTDTNYRQRIVDIIMHNADYLKRFTYGKHVLSRLERERHACFH
jgi:pumilio RNA-binding family